MEAGSDWGSAFNLSPKVVVPFLAGVVGWVVTGITSGFFDTTNLVVLISTLAYSVLGVAAPPAPTVRQSQVEALRRR